MVTGKPQPDFARRRGRRYRYIITLVLFAALIGGWSWFWDYASGQARATIDAWRAREAKAGRVYSCGSETIGGYPFRLEVECDRASAAFRSNEPPLELRTAHILAAVQVYDPTLLIAELTGPLTIADPGAAPKFEANWKLMQSSIRGTPAAPQRVSIVFDYPNVDRIDGAVRQTLAAAKHLELHGRIIEGSVTDHPVIEAVLRFTAASAPGYAPAAVRPADADITAVLHGLGDFSPKPWAARFREIQAAGGHIDITKARVAQGETIAVGSGKVMLNAQGRLDGQLTVTVAGVDAFLTEIGAQRAVQQSKPMDRLAGALDRLAPGLGDVARQQAGANIGFGLNLIGEQTTLESRPAVTLPLRFTDGAMFLGPIPLGNAPALF
jgi:hypothetical protein